MMKLKRFALAAFLTFSLLSAAENEVADFSRFAKPPAGKKVKTVIPDKMIDYGSFTISPVKDIPWQIVYGMQAKDAAFWTILDEISSFHTIIGMVKLSPPDPRLKNYASGKGLKTLRRQLEERMKKDPRNEGRMQKVRVSSKIIELNGMKGVFLDSSALDTGGRYANKKEPFRLFGRSFVAVTPDNRMLNITYSERHPLIIAEINSAAANAFFKAVRLK